MAGLIADNPHPVLYDGDRLAIEYDAFGSVLRAYDHGAGADEPLIWYEAVPGGTTRRYLHADHQGSIVAVADQNGNPIAINGYDAWGVPNPGNIGRFGYTGQAWLPELGMWYYKARIYSPTLGRFLQTDPVGYEGGMDLYSYVGNDPVDRRDPTGLKSDDAPDGCGTRFKGQSTAGCYSFGGKGSPGTKTTLLFIPKLSSPGGRAIAEILKDKEVRAQLNEAWRRSLGDTNKYWKKQEWGFWVQKVGNHYIVGGLIHGDGPFIHRTDIQRGHDLMPGANIFIHVHPFRAGEIDGVEGIELTELDRGIGLAFESLIISVARPEPYNGRNAYADYADEFYGHR